MDQVVVANHQPAYAQSTKKRKRRKRKTEKDEKKKSGEDEMEKLLKGEQEDQLIDLKLLKVEKDVSMMDSKVGRSIDITINKLLNVLKRYQTAQTLRRLAELYSEKAKRLNIDTMEAHQKRMEKWFQANQEGEPPKEPDPDLWLRYNRKAVTVCEFIIDRYPQYSEMDDAYFFMASNLREIGQAAKGNDYFRKLVTEYPKSDFAPEAYMAIGDYYFGNNNVYDAMPAFKKVLEYEQTNKLWGYAKYKLAWCEYNLGAYDTSIKYFQEVVEWSDAQGTASNITLKEEALRDLVMAYADQENKDQKEIVREAEEYFMTVGGKKYFRMMLVRLGDILTNQGKLDGAIMVYKRLINDYPLHLDNPEFQMRIVEAYSNKGDKENTTKEIITLVDYAKPPEESKWVEANHVKEPDAINEAWVTAERMLIRTVVDYHKEARKINRDEVWDRTQELYDIYLKYFSKSDKFYDVNWNYAELLWTRAHNYDRACHRGGDAAARQANCDLMTEYYHRAGKGYMKVAEMDRKGKHFEEASYSAILSLEKLVHEEIRDWMNKTKEKSRRVDKGYKLKEAAVKKEREKTHVERCEETVAFQEQFKPRQMSESVTNFVAACDLYIDNIPKSKYKIDIIYKVAIIHYTHNNFDEAVSRFEMITNDYPTHRLAEFSANLILDSLNLKRDWRALYTKVREYLKNRRLTSKAGFRRELRELNEKVTFKKVETTECEALALPERTRPAYEKWYQAAQEYQQFCDEFKRSKFREMAMYNAGVHLVAAGRILQAIDQQKLLLKTYPKSAYREEVHYKIGLNYMAMAMFDDAVKQFDDYTKIYPKGKHKDEALYNAAIFHENLGNTAKAIEYKKNYMKTIDDEDQKDNMRFTFGIMWKEQDKVFPAYDAFTAYLNGRKKDITWPKFDKNGNVEKRGQIRGEPNRIFAAHLELLEIYDHPRVKNYKAKEATYQTIYKLGFCDIEEGYALGQEARDAIALTHFRKIEPELKAFKEMQLVVNYNPWEWTSAKIKKWDSKMKEKLTTKVETANDLKGKYLEILKLKSTKYTLASLYKLGEVFRELSVAIYNSEMPPYFMEFENPDDLYVQYVDSVMERIGKPAEIEAIGFWERCLQTSYKLGVYNKYSMDSLDQLSILVPDAYPPAKEFAPKPGFESDSWYMARFKALKLPDNPEAPQVEPVEPAPAEPAEPTQPVESAPEPEKTACLGTQAAIL